MGLYFAMVIFLYCKGYATLHSLGICSILRIELQMKELPFAEAWCNFVHTDGRNFPHRAAKDFLNSMNESK